MNGREAEGLKGPFLPFFCVSMVLLSLDPGIKVAMEMLLMSFSIECNARKSIRLEL